jgi:hypothetical protein
MLPGPTSSLRCARIGGDRHWPGQRLGEQIGGKAWVVNATLGHWIVHRPRIVRARADSLKAPCASDLLPITRPYCPRAIVISASLGFIGFLALPRAIPR